MSKTKIDWADYSINPVLGQCPNEACPLGERCYARGFYTRFGKKKTGELNPQWDPTIRYEPAAFDELKKIKKPSRIFVGSTIELFGDWVKASWLDHIFQMCALYPQHTFIFLTKCPGNLHRWKFPDNCWPGISATSKLEYINALEWHQKIGARVHIISLEPLLSWDATLPKANDNIMLYSQLDWLIIGKLRQASKKNRPDAAWIREIVNAADKAKIPVFLKNNLSWLPQEKPFYTRDQKVYEECEAGDPCHACGAGIQLRQEFPKL